MDVGVFQGRKIYVTGGRRYFGHKLRNELKNMGKKIQASDLVYFTTGQELFVTAKISLIFTSRSSNI